MKYFISFLFFLIGFYIYSQDELLGPKELLEKISNSYKNNVKDFVAKIKWIQNDNVQSGKITFKNPQKIKIEFDDPANQVICSNGYDFWVYLPMMNMVLYQELMAKEKKKDEQGKTQIIHPAFLLNPSGYDRILKDYSIEYAEGKTLVDYKDTKIYKLKLIRWRTHSSGFNVIYFYIEPTGLLRKVEGITAAYKKVVIELDDYKLNQQISDSFFDYQPPAHASKVENFITNQGE